MNVRVVAAYAAMCAIWGTTWLGIKVSLSGLPPVAGVGIRFILASCFLYVLGAAAGPRTGSRPPLKLILVLALTLFGGNYLLTYFSETHLASGLVAVLFGTVPFFIFGFGSVMLGEDFPLRSVAGAVLALAGVAVISLSGRGGDWIYAAAALGASLLSAFANVYLKRYADSDPFSTLPPAMLLSGVVITSCGLYFERIDVHAATAWPSVLALLYLAIFGSGFAFYLNHWLLQRLPTWVVGLSALVIPVLAVFVGILIGHEAFGTRELAGAALVIAGVWLALSRRQADAQVAGDVY